MGHARMGNERENLRKRLCVEKSPTNFEPTYLCRQASVVRALLPVLVPVLILCGATQAQAQNLPQEQERPREDGGTSDASLQKRVDSLQAQIQRMSKDLGSLGRIQEQGSADMLQSDGWLSFVAEMQERMRVMESTLTDLTGRVEQLERYGTRGGVNGGVSGGGRGQQKSNAQGREGGSADELFSAAQNLLRTRKLEDAVRAFGDFAKMHPSDQRVSEALFYLGESYAVLQDDKAAMRTFLEGYKKDRNDAFAPRLLLRLGQILAKLKKGEQACRVLREYKKRFGDKDADMTKLAESELAANSCSSS